MEYIGIGLGVLAFVVPALLAIILSVRTDRLVEREDRRAKEIIEAGNKRHEEMHKDIVAMIQAGNKRHEDIILEMRKSTDALLTELKNSNVESKKSADALLAEFKNSNLEIKKSNEKIVELIAKVIERKQL
jgi:hypothetical protein